MLRPYGNLKSRQDFTQPQLMACLVLRALLKTTYRGLIDFLRGHEQLREVLGMDGKLPHYTTLQKFTQRKGVLEVADAIIGQIGQAALKMELAEGTPPSLAIDATGIESSGARKPAAGSPKGSTGGC